MTLNAKDGGADKASNPATAQAAVSAAFAAGQAAVTEPLAPGSRILVDSRPVQRAGVACFVAADDGVYLITCGHVFEPGAVGTAVVASGQRVALLTHNFLDDTPQLDAAYCLLTPRGRQLAAVSAGAPTWLAGIAAPADGQGRPATFWPTNEDAGNAIRATVNASSASQSLSNEFWQLALSQLLRSDPITQPGDSGSLLALDDRYYGSCTGTPSSSYFTPLHLTVERMRQTLGGVVLWQPG